MLHSISVQDFMEANLVTFKPDQDIMQAIRLLLDNGISGAPVVDHFGNISGILSEKDCLQVALKAGYHGEWGGVVADFMSPSVVTVEADTSILAVAKMFLEAPFKRYPVVSDNRLVGQISRRDVLRAVEKISAESSFA